MEEFLDAVVNGIRILFVVAVISVPLAIWKIVEIVGHFAKAW